MGQQQLILLVLATVIVGLAIVVGIRAFTENSARSNADAMMQDAVRIANDLQAWKKKPAPFGGQGKLDIENSTTTAQDPADYSNATWALVGYSDNDGSTETYTNLNGVFTLGGSATETTITGVNTTENNEIVVTLSGVTDTDITGEVTCLAGFDDAGAACTAGGGGL